MADYCRLNVGWFKLKDENLTIDDIKEKWAEEYLPIFGDVERDMGFRIKNGKFQINMYDQDEFLDVWDDWDGYLYGDSIKERELLRFIGSFIAEGESASVKIDCENDSTDVEWADKYRLSKIGGNVNIEHMGSQEYDPDW